MQASTKHVYIYKYNVLVLKMNQDSYEEMIWINWDISEFNKSFNHSFHLVTLTHARTHAHTHTHIYTHTRTRTHTHIHMHTRAHTHTHTLIRTWLLCMFSLQTGGSKERPFKPWRELILAVHYKLTLLDRCCLKKRLVKSAIILDMQIPDSAHMTMRESFFIVFKWNLVLFTSYSNSHKFPIWSPALNQYIKKLVFWLVQILLFIADLDHGCNQNKSLSTV